MGPSAPTATSSDPVPSAAETAAAPAPAKTRVRVNSSTARRKSTSSSGSKPSLGSSSSASERNMREGEGRGGGQGEGAYGTAPQYDPQARYPLSPGRDPELFDTHEEWQTHHELEQRSMSHNLPLILVALPPLGAIFLGRAENWSDALVLLLVCFYLYQLIKVPWDLYYASHARYVLKAKQPFTSSSTPVDPVLAEHRLRAASILRRTELLSLFTTGVVPIVGAWLLHLVRGILSDPDRYINKFTISLFSLATAVKPILHFIKLAKNSSLYYQEAVWFPSTEVHLLRRRIEALELQLSQVFATKDDVRTLRDGIDIPLSQLSKAVKRSDKREQVLRLSAEERFAELEAKFRVINRMTLEQEELISSLRDEQQRSLHPIATLFKIINHVLLGQNHFGKKRRQAVRWFERGALYYVFLPVNVSALAIDWVAGGDEGDGSLSR